jgi:parallel beta-helix repeat protein
MSRKLVLTTIFVAVLICMLGLSFKVQRVEASGTIYIEADGSVYPVGSPISTLDNVTYWLTSDASYSIVILRDNIVFNGSRYKILGPGSGYGINATQRTNVTICDVQVTGFDYGIWLYESSNSTVSGNIVSECNWNAITIHYSTGSKVSYNNVIYNYQGIMVAHSFFNILSNNNITNNRGGYAFDIDHDSHHNLIYENLENNNTLFPGGGVYLAPYSYNNTFFKNNITDRVIIHKSPNNTFFHNSFITLWQIMSYPPGYTDIWSNIWDDGYPSGGNYWSDYTGTDYNQGSEQNISGSDGIGDTEYSINVNNTDHYPLMGMFSDFNTTSEYHVQTICNSTISNFQFNDTAIRFNVSGENGTTGFCRICIPTSLMNGTYRVFVNGTEVSFNLLPCSNSKYSYLYFNYTHSTQEVIIIPEFPSFFILSPFMAISLLFLTIRHKYRRRILKARG